MNNDKKVILNEEDKKAILNVMEENVIKNENLKMVSELPSNNNVEYHEPEAGETVQAKVKIDPKTGESVVVDVINDEVKATEQYKNIL